MKAEYSVKTCQVLEKIFKNQKILRPFRVQRYDPGADLTYEIQGVMPAGNARLKCEVEEFVGGGFAGQVYKIKVKEIELLKGQIEGIRPGDFYAMKVFIPPSRFAKLFRNISTRLAFRDLSHSKSIQMRSEPGPCGRSSFGAAQRFPSVLKTLWWTSWPLSSTPHSGAAERSASGLTAGCGVSKRMTTWMPEKNGDREIRMMSSDLQNTVRNESL